MPVNPGDREGAGGGAKPMARCTVTFEIQSGLTKEAIKSMMEEQFEHAKNVEVEYLDG